MGKCLVTTLQESVNDSELLKLGELRIKCFENTESNVHQFFSLTSSTAQDASIIDGAGRFTSSFATENGLKCTVGVNTSGSVIHTMPITDACTISVPNKYDLTGIHTGANTFTPKKVLYEMDIEQLAYSDNLKQLNCPLIKFNGDVSKLNNCTLTKFVAYSVNGDFSHLLNPALTNFGVLAGYNASFNIEKLAACTNITQVSAVVGGMYGNIESFADRDNVEFMSLTPVLAGGAATQSDIFGSIETLGKLVNATYIIIYNAKLTGKIENLLNSLHSNGKTSGSVYIGFDGCANVTCDDASLKGNNIKINFTTEGWSKA